MLLLKAEHRVTGRYYKWNFGRARIDRMAARIRSVPAYESCDVIFSPMSRMLVGGLQDSARPLFYFCDSTYVSMVRMGGYPAVQNLARRSARRLYALEHSLFHRAMAVIVTSRWAKDSVVNDYDVPPNKVFIAHYGANILPSRVPPRERVLGKTKSNRCRLLFVGKRWQRKRGDIALKTLVALKAMGVRASLTIVGCRPPRDTLHPDMEVIPFLDKNDANDDRRLAELYYHADFFIMPSQAEAFGITYAEASAFGVPSIATDVGGVSDAVKDGENGFLLALDANPEAYARVIADLYRDDERYYRLVRSSRDRFERELNWTVWGQRVAAGMREVLAAELGARVGSAPHKN